MENQLLNIGNNKEQYYIDIDEISNFIKIDPKDINRKQVVESEKFGDFFNPTAIINVTKYEMVKAMIDVMFNTAINLKDNYDDMDETERLIKNAETENLNDYTLPFKMAFNTLLINKIIKNYEPTSRKNKGINTKIKR
jgi:hypothetical protein